MPTSDMPQVLKVDSRAKIQSIHLGHALFPGNVAASFANAWKNLLCYPVLERFRLGLVGTEDELVEAGLTHEGQGLARIQT